MASKANVKQELPRKVLIVLLESILAREDKNNYFSFKHLCNSKKDDEGNLVFGEPASELRRGKLWYVAPAVSSQYIAFSGIQLNPIVFLAVQIKRTALIRKARGKTDFLEKELQILQTLENPSAALSYEPCSPLQSPRLSSPKGSFFSTPFSPPAASPSRQMSSSGKNLAGTLNSMLEQGSKIACMITLTPEAAMPFGIVGTAIPNAKDQYGTLRKRFTIRVPVWDERDAPLYAAKLTESGNSIILEMPSTASYLRDVDNVTKIRKNMGLCKQAEDNHTAFCNKLKKNNISTVKILLLFPDGETYNNKSFNIKVGPNDDFKLERKVSLIYEKTNNSAVPRIMRLTVAFEAAMDQDEGLDANKHVKEMDDILEDIYSKMRFVDDEDHDDRSDDEGMSSL